MRSAAIAILSLPLVGTILFSAFPVKAANIQLYGVITGSPQVFNLGAHPILANPHYRRGVDMQKTTLSTPLTGWNCTSCTEADPIDYAFNYPSGLETQRINNGLSGDDTYYLVARLDDGSSDNHYYVTLQRSSGIWTTSSQPPITADITATTTWPGNRVYTISGDIEIATGVTLTINEGAIIKFDTSTSSSLTINGTLNALGNRIDAADSWNPVAFTSIKDDNIGNPPDTNNDATSTIPAAGDWGGIIVNSGGTANLYGVIVRYGGDGSGAGIYNAGGNIFIASSTVAYNDSHGIYNDSGTTTARSIDLAFQNYGLYINGGSASIAATSTLHDNDLYAVYNNTAFTINAEGNYWATSTGPSATYGSAVHGSVDYTPYVSTLHYIDPSCTPGGSSCASVVNRELFYDASTTYSSELNSAINAWDGENEVDLISSSTAELVIEDKNFSDVSWKGHWLPDILPGDKDKIELNEYYLDSDPSNERQNTIAHELGHALGLWHSYSGNIMYHNQSSQTSFGSQDLRDYHYLW